MSANAQKRVAVTGLGVIAAIGEGVDEFRKGLFGGRCGIGPVTLFDTAGFPCRVAAQANGLDGRAQFEPKAIRRISRCDMLGLIAAEQALSNAGLNPNACDPARMGTVMGGGAGGMLSWEGYRRAAWSGEKGARPSLLLPAAQCTLTDLVATHYGLTGFRATISTACSSSATAIGYAFDLIQGGTQDMVIAGGSEALSELTFAGFNALRLMDPLYCRPFDMNRRGLSLGEGSGMLVLEAYERAVERGAVIYGEVLGYATNSDAFHMTSPDPEGKGMAGVMGQALDTAGLIPGQVDYLNAHGTATKINDQTETRAIKEVFGDEGARNLAISSTKSMVGHCLGAAGAVEAVATILALYEQKVPPTIHLTEPDPHCDLDYVPGQTRPQRIRYAISNSFAFGGNNTSVVFGKGQVRNQVENG
jgi:3-oxoacyl-[acyl-carrier-protein] synthase II